MAVMIVVVLFLAVVISFMLRDIIFGCHRQVGPMPVWFTEWISEHKEAVRYKTKEEAFMIRKDRRERIAARKEDFEARYIDRGANI